MSFAGRRASCVLRALRTTAEIGGVGIELNYQRSDLTGDKKQIDCVLTCGGGPSIVTDVVVTHPIRKSVMSKAAAAKEAAIGAAERAAEKQRKYRALQEGGEHRVIPFVVETYGASDIGVKQVLKAITKHASAVHFYDEREFMSAAWRRLSVALQIGNARAMQIGLGLWRRQRIPIAIGRF